MHSNTHSKTISDIRMMDQKSGVTSPQYLSARTIRPSLFLNEADFHLPLISPQKRQVTDYQIIKQTLPKSEAVSPVFRRTQIQQDSQDQFLFVQTTIRKLKKQKLYIKDSHRSQQFLPQIEDHNDRNVHYSTPKNKISTLSSLPTDSQVLLSPVSKQSTPIVNKGTPIQTNDDRNSKEFDLTQPSHQSSLPEQSSSSSNQHQPPHHKKTVSFRQSIFVIDMNNGQVTKDQLSENSKPLQHISKPEIKEEQHDEDKRIKFRRTRNFHLSDKLV
ncbi:unnamed protein product (macronuclear) [Paramecium tetraurelia]|uniref:Uncharacterized protein n=1 Tax=Paramecium tetraurelia TaxID=5888 RepID=A0D9D6_PARTE|nr:uncharacterized protein GSPATT00014583001 [Paramecium tetraurelia]CAK79653.1 unnamed protein product [Paramecium tetraurelia]|eukprot:XP_001447050.1 hypothetical protein (macronuclear) [Paramecium tetraurelia strain d4-2]